MSKAQRITPDCQPVFPCWLWNKHDGWLTWSMPPNGPWQIEFTHFHPDQPTVPTERPEEMRDMTPEERRATDAFFLKQFKSPALPPEVQAACERLKDAIASLPHSVFVDVSPTDLRTLLAWVEGRKL